MAPEHRGIEHLGVVIPAHNEEDEILDCLTAVGSSVSHLRKRHPDIHVQIFVVADACTDNTLSLMTTHAADSRTTSLIEVDVNNVGRSRNAGILAFLAGLPQLDAEVLNRTWITMTDADTHVPVDWLDSHIHHALTGIDCLVGTVEPRPETATPQLLERWFAHHHMGENHSNVFGANLGVRGSWYMRAGGVPPLTTGEDTHIVDTLRTLGATILSTDTTRVKTSARLVGRVTHGFSTYCRLLTSELEPDLE